MEEEEEEDEDDGDDTEEEEEEEKVEAEKVQERLLLLGGWAQRGLPEGRSPGHRAVDCFGFILISPWL